MTMGYFLDLLRLPQYAMTCIASRSVSFAKIEIKLSFRRSIFSFHVLWCQFLIPTAAAGQVRGLLSDFVTRSFFSISFKTHKPGFTLTLTLFPLSSLCSISHLKSTPSKEVVPPDRTRDTSHTNPLTTHTKPRLWRCPGSKYVRI